MAIPLHVELKRFSRDRPGLVAQLADYQFNVTRIYQVLDEESFPPQIPPGTFVEDFRFSHGPRNVPPVMVGRVINGWPTLAESKLKPGYGFTQFDPANFVEQMVRKRGSRFCPVCCRRCIISQTRRLRSAWRTPVHIFDTSLSVCRHHFRPAQVALKRI